MPEMTNEELVEFRMGLVAMKGYKAKPEDSPEKKAAILVLSNRVGNAYNAIKAACDAFDEQDEVIREPFIRKMDGRPVYILDDDGKPVGMELTDRLAYKEAKKPIMKEKVIIPEIKPITYDLLKRADYPLDGELVAILGSFITGEPEEVSNAG